MDRILRWGMLGTANIGDALLKGINMTGDSRLHAVASRDPTKAVKWVSTRDVPRPFGSYEEMLRSGEIDLVYNALPNSLHAEWTIRALDAGLPVLCEKPLAADTAEAARIAEASRRTGVPVIEAFAYRYHPIYGRVIDAVRRGDIGKLVSIYSVFTWFLDDRTQIPASAPLAGGALMDVGCYCVNVSRLLTGAEPLRVMAMERRTEVDDTLMGMMEFPGGVLAQFECGIESEERKYLEIKGTHGMIVVDEPWFAGEETGRYILRHGGRDEIVSTPGGNGYHLEAADLVRAFKTRSSPLWPIEDSVANMAAIDALFLSAKTGASTEVPPANRAIRG
jgi:D-xylose 1-dehydrogenase (NADP+, D-xylono-1,5-lactone-forming)